MKINGENNRKSIMHDLIAFEESKKSLELELDILCRIIFCSV